MCYGKETLEVSEYNSVENEISEMFETTKR